MTNVIPKGTTGHIFSCDRRGFLKHSRVPIFDIHPSNELSHDIWVDDNIFLDMTDMLRQGIASPLSLFIREQLYYDIRQIRCISFSSLDGIVWYFITLDTRISL